MTVSKNYEYIKEPTHGICTGAYYKLWAFTKDTESWKLFISQNPDQSRDTMLEIINELLLDYQIPTEEESTTITNHRPYLTLKNHIVTIHPFNIKYAVDTEKGVLQYIPNEEEALDGNACDDLRAEFEPQYENGSPF